MNREIPRPICVEEAREPDGLSAPRGMILGSVCGALIWLAVVAIVAWFVSGE